MWLDFVSSPESIHTNDRALGGFCIGASADKARFDAQSSPWPIQAIVAPLLGLDVPVLHETWFCNSPASDDVQHGHSEGIAWRRMGNLLYGVLELAEADFSDAANAAVAPLQLASADIYRRIFRLLDAQQLPQLWRVWNYVADINRETHGLERYRQFNIGRQEAWREFHRTITGNVPAACAIGLPAGALKRVSIAFLASDMPVIPIENPRQVSAYHYPADYGPCSPTFSRAALASMKGQEVLFISGTASIVGHQTLHAGDVRAQCDETLANIAAVLDEANRHAHSAPFTLASLSYRVYVRHLADFASIQARLREVLGQGVEIVYLQADICRADLLLEIEAHGIHATEHVHA